MKITIDCYDAKRIMQDCDRDYYSVNGLDALLEYYDEIDPDTEFDPVAICCDCTEYGEYGASHSLAALICNYGYIYSVHEWRVDTGASEYDEDDYITALINVLEEYTTILHVVNGNYIVFAF